jgi:hypothetical protein
MCWPRRTLRGRRRSWSDLDSGANRIDLPCSISCLFELAMVNRGQSNRESLGPNMGEFLPDWLVEHRYY